MTLLTEYFHLFERKESEVTKAPTEGLKVDLKLDPIKDFEADFNG